MIEILLLILKIIGIVLVFVLGLVLIIACLVLFIPIRYNYNFKYNDEDSSVNCHYMKLSWILRVITFKIAISLSGLNYEARLFGIRAKWLERKIFKFNEKDDAVDEEVSTEIDDELNNELNDESDIEDVADSELHEMDKSLEKDDLIEEDSLYVEDGLFEEDIDFIKRFTDTEDIMVLESDDLENVHDARKLLADMDDFLMDISAEDMTKAKEARKESHVGKESSVETTLDCDDLYNFDELDEIERQKILGKSKRKFRFKVPGWMNKLKSINFQVLNPIYWCKMIINKFKEMVNLLIKLIKTAVESIQELFRKVVLISELLEKPSTIMGLEKVKDYVSKTCKHILPRKKKIHLTIGFDDPSTTGKVLASMGVIYPILGKNFCVEPNFYEKELKASCSFKGRVRGINVIIIVIRVIRDKAIKRLLKNIDRVKEEF